MSMSKSGVKIIDRGAREIFPMSQRAGMFDDECDECGASSWTEDPSTGARTCELCGGQTDGPNFDTSAPNWTAEEPGTRSSRSKRSEWIGGISNRRLAKARPAGDALRYDSQKIMEVKERSAGWSSKKMLGTSVGRTPMPCRTGKKNTSAPEEKGSIS